ncbi:hypothetical protein [Rubrobacter marinus]|nr:hypothetical protein [Rubrobacter marinus]
MGVCSCTSPGFTNSLTPGLATDTPARALSVVAPLRLTGSPLALVPRG